MFKTVTVELKQHLWVTALQCFLKDNYQDLSLIKILLQSCQLNGKVITLSTLGEQHEEFTTEQDKLSVSG